MFASNVPNTHPQCSTAEGGCEVAKRRYNYEQFKSYVNEVPRAWFLGRMYVAIFGACDLLSPLFINT
jgi:hypothetical protein